MLAVVFKQVKWNLKFKNGKQSEQWKKFLVILIRSHGFLQWVQILQNRNTTKRLEEKNCVVWIQLIQQWIVIAELEVRNLLSELTVRSQ